MKIYFLDKPYNVAIGIFFWLALWPTLSLVSNSGFIYPLNGALLFIASDLIFIFIVSILLKKSKLNLIAKREVLTNSYPFFKLQLIIAILFFLFVCVPELLKNPFGYRLSIFFDNDRGIISSIFSSPGEQFLFTVVYYYIPMCLALISAFNGKNNLFIKSAFLLGAYAVVTLSRALWLTILMLYLFLPHIRYRLLKISVIVIGCLVIIPDYFKYQILGFSLIERFIQDYDIMFVSNLTLSGTLAGLLWPLFSFYRLIDPSFKSDFEIVSSSNSLFVDIGIKEQLNYNAFYTFLQGPLYDFGYLSPFVLGLMLSVIFIAIVKLKDVFLYRSFMGLFLINCINGNQMNSISDRLNLIYIIVALIIYKKGKKCDTT
jgi:hypothetical protein